MPENIETLAKLPEMIKRLQSAFPNSLSNDVNQTLSRLPVGHLQTTQHDIGSVIISGESLHIPSRFYYPEPDESSLNGLNNINLSILACLYSRHHNGFVRLKYVCKLFYLSDVWVSPFILNLIGEYVIEIIEVISQNINLLPLRSYNEFIIENPAYIHILKQKIISYWNCYYRVKFPYFKDYVGFQVADSLGLWKKDEIKHLMAH